MLEKFKSVLNSKWMPYGAAVLGFLESSVVFAPIEPLAIPAMLIQKRRAFVIAGFLLLGSVCGAVTIYTISAWFAEPLLESVLQQIGMHESYTRAHDDLHRNGFLALLLVGITPIPFQIGAAAAGAIGYSFLKFLLAVTLARGVRYLVLAGFVVLLGSRVQQQIEKHESSIMIAGAVVFVVFALWLAFN